jgi:DNA replication protein DnaC
MITSLKSLANERQRRRELRIRQLEQERDARVAAILVRIPELAVIKSVQTDIGLDLARLMLRVPTKFGKTFAELEAWSKQLSTERETVLQKHGLDPNDLEVRWDCRDCKNTGWLPAEPAGPDTVVPPRKCHCLIQEEMSDLYRASGLAGTLLEQTFDRFDPTVYPPEHRDYMHLVQRECRRFADDVVRGVERDGLLLLGEVGLGKTFLSSAIANVVMAGKKTVVYLTFAEFLDLIRLHKFDDDEAYQEGAERLMNADLIILDDLGAEKITEFVGQELFTLVNHRMNQGMPMVVSTNLPPAMLEQTYGARIASRLLNGFRALQLRGDDVRFVLKRRRARD